MTAKARVLRMIDRELEDHLKTRRFLGLMALAFLAWVSVSPFWIQILCGIMAALMLFGWFVFYSVELSDSTFKQRLACWCRFRTVVWKEPELREFAVNVAKTEFYGFHTRESLADDSVVYKFQNRFKRRCKEAGC